MRRAALVALLLVVLAAPSGLGALERVQVRDVAPGVPLGFVGLALLFGAVVGSGFMLGRRAVQDRAEARRLGPTAAVAPTAPAFAPQEEQAYKRALVKKLGGEPPRDDDGGPR